MIYNLPILFLNIFQIDAFKRYPNQYWTVFGYENCDNIVLNNLFKLLVVLELEILSDE